MRRNPAMLNTLELKALTPEKTDRDSKTYGNLQKEINTH